MGTAIQITAGEGDVAGYLAVPEVGSGPGVVICHAWWGLNEFFVGLCDRLAAEGFVALAADMYGGKTAATIQEAEALVGQLTSEHAGAVATAALDALLARPEVRGDTVGAIGFSMGAAWAMELSVLRPKQVVAVVDFYGATDGDFSGARASYLGHFAPGDEWEPVEYVNGLESLLREAGHEVTFHWYPGTGHWFFEDNRPDAWDADAASLAWDRTLAFLRAHLG